MQAGLPVEQHHVAVLQVALHHVADLQVAVRVALQEPQVQPVPVLLCQHKRSGKGSGNCDSLVKQSGAA